MTNDNGLVDEYEKLQIQKKDIERKEEEIKRKIVELAKQKNTNVLFGTSKNCTIKEYSKVHYPEDKGEFAKLLKSEGLYELFSQPNYSRLSSAISKGDISITKNILDRVKVGKETRVILFERGRI